MILQPDLLDVRRIIAEALREDVGQGDVTTQLLVPETMRGTMSIVAGEALVACGAGLMPLVFEALKAPVRCTPLCEDGQRVDAGQEMLRCEGPARALLTGERTALNLLQRMCGVATKTARFVEALGGTKTELLDTRKTMPGLRALDKYAVRAGGGRNHRMRLDDMVLVKDNHIALCGGVAQAVATARAGTKLPVVVECDTLAQVAEALEAKPDRILLDNMTLETLRRAVAMAEGKVALEASGGVTLETIRSVAETGVGYISVGCITHSAAASDIKAEILLA